MTRLLLALGVVGFSPAVAAAQADSLAPLPDTTAVAGVGVKASLGAPPLALRVPPQYRQSWVLGPRPVPGAAAAAWQTTLSAAVDSSQGARSSSQVLVSLYGGSQESADSAEAALQKRGLFGINRSLVDLTLDGNIRLELRADRLKNLRCTPASLSDPSSGCRGEINGPRLDNQMTIRSGGVIGRRLRVNVDWDTQRDFTNSNIIQVYYEGLEDEPIRRVEVGTVVFRPPSSRYLTAAIPTNNFGVNALFELGQLQMQVLAATQKGSAIGERVFTIGQAIATPQDRSQRDLDFEFGRFYWTVDPRTLPHYPDIDALSLDTLSVSPDVRPAQIRVYRYRVPQLTGGVDPNLGGIPACAFQGPAGKTFGPVPWQLLVLGADYYTDPSGLWIAMAQRVDLRADYVAVSYVTEAGITVGSFPGLPKPGAGTTCASVDTLRMIVEPLVGSDQPSFHHEMRQFYRVAGQDLDPVSLKVDISVNRSERPLPPSSFTTYLSALGLSVPTDENTFDWENRLFPRARDPGAELLIHESFLAFPSIKPFANPAVLGPTELADSLYQTPVYLLFSQGPPTKFQFRLRYSSTGAGDRTALNLNALQILEGSEKLYLGGRLLTRGTDYTIAYETGLITFLNPEALFGSGVAQITARFEERGIFAVAPTSIFGLTTHYDLGRAGGFNLVGIYQKESSAFARPALGFEASANLVAGGNTELHFRPTALSRLVSSITNRTGSSEAFFDINGEFAFTRPDPNRTGQAYLQEFEGVSGSGVSLGAAVWQYGSTPQSTVGLDPSLGFAATFDSADAVQMIWQNLIPGPNGSVVQFFPENIDPNIVTAGRSQVPETVMYLTLHADTAGGVVQQDNRSLWTQPPRPGTPRWRSMQTAISTVGVDFTANTYIEFWLYNDAAKSAENAGVNLVFDLGQVNEDALAIAPDTLTVTGADSLYVGRQYVGAGVLNTERQPNGIFNAQDDDVGILGDIPPIVLPNLDTDPAFPLCQTVLGTSVQVFPWGDLSARCTRGNGFLDTEDLNGDNVLNAQGPNDNVNRYVVSLTDTQYVVRKGVVDPATGAGWTLYRIPLRAPTAVIGTPNIRLVQALRVTLVAPPAIDDIVARVALARLTFVGAPWLARAPAPIAGIAGSTAEPTGSVVVSVVSTLDKNLGYVPPPGVLISLNNLQGSTQELGAQIDEKSLRVVARQLGQGSRAEAYFRFPAGNQRFLSYKQLRVWMRGGYNLPDWDAGGLLGYIKVESDADNFYMYQTTLHSNGEEEAWNPEVLVDLKIWADLRAEIESRVEQGLPPSGADVCGGDPAAYVACQGGYIVHILSPAVNPPNLAAAQGLSTGIIRVAPGVSDSTELWVDDVRLSEPITTMGTAWALDARLAAGDVFDLTFLISGVNGQFRQLGAQPSFRTTGGLLTGGNFRVDRFLPASVGLLIPVNLTYATTKVDPQLLTGSDIQASSLPGLRKPNSNTGGINVLVRRSARGTNPWMRILADPLALTGGYVRGRGQTELSRSTTDNYTAAVTYNIAVTRHGAPIRLTGLVNSLPTFMRESDFGNSLKTASYSLLPTSLRLRSGLAREQTYFYSYVSPVERPIDAAAVPALALNYVWRNSAGLTWQPLGMLIFNADVASSRDLRQYGDSTAQARLATAERQDLLGIDVGVERDRTTGTSLAIAPRIASWFRPRFGTSSNFALNRYLNSRQLVRADGDTAGAFLLPQTFSNLRSYEWGFSIDYARGIRQVLGDSSGVGNLIRRFRPLDISRRTTRTSTFDLAVFQPSLGYILGLGGLSSFLSQDGQLALGATQAVATQVATGLDFAFGLSITGLYSEITTDRYQSIGGAQRLAVISQREWPSGQVRFSRPFSRGPFALVSVGATIRQRRGSTTQPVSASVVSLVSNQTRNVSPELGITFRNGIGLASNLSLLEQQSASNGALTLLDQADLNGSLSYAFPLPRALSRARKLARSSFSVVVSKATQCLFRAASLDCQVINDTRRQEYRGSIDTDIISTLTAGLQLGYTVNDFRSLDRKNSQLFIVASLNLSLFAGDYR